MDALREDQLRQELADIETVLAESANDYSATEITAMLGEMKEILAVRGYVRRRARNIVLDDASPPAS